MKAHTMRLLVLATLLALIVLGGAGVTAGAARRRQKRL